MNRFLLKPLQDRRISQSPGHSQLGLLTRFHPVLVEFLETVVGKNGYVDTALQHFVDCFCDACDWEKTSFSLRKQIFDAMAMMLSKHENQFQYYALNPICKAELKRTFNFCWRDNILQKCWQSLQILESNSAKPYFQTLKCRYDNPNLTTKNLHSVLSDQTNVKFSSPENLRTFLVRAQRRFSGFVVSEVVQTFRVDIPDSSQFLRLELQEIALDHHLIEAQKSFCPSLENVIESFEVSALPDRSDMASSN